MWQKTSNKLHSLTHSLMLTHHNDTSLVVGQHDRHQYSCWPRGEGEREGGGGGNREERMEEEEVHTYCRIDVIAFCDTFIITMVTTSYQVPASYKLFCYHGS